MKQVEGAAKRRFSVSPLAAAVTVALGSACGAGALAQPGDPQPALEEVVVTASRRPTTVQELPFNISALGGEMLARQRLTSLTEFSRWVPGLMVVDQGARSSDLMTVRGLNVRSLNDSEFLDNGSGGTVQTYLGDIPLYLDLKLHDVERVEVLLGPQGTLYGAGTLGGAVRYIPRAPDTREFSLDLHGDLYGIEHSSGTGYQTDAAVNIPLVEDRLALRTSVYYLDAPGFVDYPYVLREPGVSNPQPDLSDPADVAANLQRVEDADWEETVSGRVSLLWEASERVRATLNYYYQNQDVGARTINHRHAFGTGHYEAGHRFLEPKERENRLLALDVVADLGFAELTWAAGSSEYDEVGQRDQTDLLLGFEVGYEEFPSFAAFTRELAEEERINHEVRLVSTGSGPWSWIGGLFYNDLTGNSSSEELVPGYTEFRGLDLPTGDLEYVQLGDYELIEQAAFGEVSYRFGDRWAVTLGGRFFDYELTQSASFDFPIDGLFGLADPPVYAEDDGFLGKLNVAYDFGDSSLAYFTISEGYRVGGANPIQLCPEDVDDHQQYVCALPHERLIDPDVTTNYEIGVHQPLADGRVDLNAALFYIDWQDIQTLGTTQYGSAWITVNGGGARSRGLELSLRARTGGPWSYVASYSYTDAELTTDAAGLIDGWQDAFAGDRLSGAPEHQGSFVANYYRMLPNGWDLDASYGLTFTGHYLTKVGMRGGGEKLGGYTLHSASVGVGQDRWSATLYADNLFDKFAEPGVRLDPSYIGEVNGFALRRYYRNVVRPRTVGVEFRYRL